MAEHYYNNKNPLYMSSLNHPNRSFNPTSPVSIFEYSKNLIGQSLHSLFGNSVLEHKRKGKGGLGQMVEELFFNYEVNSKREADFAEAHVELKCTPLLKSESNNSYRIKERLVCSMINYHEIAYTSFEDSHLITKCQLMLLLFYLHVSGKAYYDYEFLFTILWKLPEKDLLQIKKDYETIAHKVLRGEAHLLSEGDTVYLGACRKGSKGDNLQKQPKSDIKAPKRAFSLKPAYMRYILSHVTDSGKSFFTNYEEAAKPQFELVSSDDLLIDSFENLIISRFKPYIGENFLQICQLLGIESYQAKSKYADIAALIASNRESKKLSNSEEFIKSGIVMKTIRLKSNGMPKESMSFKNIDYCEVYNNDDWLESEAYEIFTNRFMFVVFKPVISEEIEVFNHKKNRFEKEQSYILDSVFFWTMPTKDLVIAKEYWENIRQAVITNNIRPQAFWSLSDKRNFHVRPKAAKKIDKTVNPNGGQCEKYCYWFNAAYVKQIIESENNDV